MQTYYVDTHAHLNDESYAGEVAAVIERAAGKGVTTIIHPDIDSKERDSMFAIQEAYPETVYCMLGLYPGSVTESWRDEISIMEGYVGRKRIVAIGEIGLDYYYSKETAGLQQEAFRVQLEMASRLDLPVNIHLRDATDDFFKILDSCKGLGLRGNLHAFSGSYETFQRLEKYGDWYVGIGGVITFKKASIAETIRQIPLERIVLETDAPYLTPTPYRGTRNESSYIPIIAQKIAEQKGISIEEVAEVTTENARKLFLSNLS